MSDVIELHRINPLHRARDAERLAALTTALRRDGWVGRPLLGELCSDGYTVRLWTGSHRFAAAESIGLDDVPVYLLDTDALAAAGYEPCNRDMLGECYRDSMPEDDDAILDILRAADPEAAALFAADAR